MDKTPGLLLEKKGIVVRDEQQAWALSIANWNLLYKLCTEEKLVDHGGRGTCR